MNNKKWYTVIEKRLNGIIYTGMTEYTNNPNDLLRRAKYAFPQYQNLEVIESIRPKTSNEVYLIF